MNPEILYAKFLEKSGGDVRTAVMMVWAAGQVLECDRELGYGYIGMWYYGRGLQLLSRLEKKAAQ